VIHTLHATLPADARLVVQSPDVERAINNACKSRSNLDSEVERPKLAASRRSGPCRPVAISGGCP